ncbi:MAG: DUF192 domain-containing protein [Verrucomicrobiota bacterium]
MTLIPLLHPGWLRAGFLITGLLATSLFLSCSGGSEPNPDQTKKTPAISDAGLLLQDAVIGEKHIQLEIANTPEAMSKGLMFRDSLEDDHGMLFVFPSPQRASFWMRNTKIPLSIAYLDREFKVLEIYDMEPFDETSVVSESNTVSFALEMEQGWFKKNKIGVGTTLTLD